MRSKRRYPLLEMVPIEGIAAEGKAIGRVDGKVVFVPFAVPGDVVDIQVTKRRTGFMEGFITAIRKRSDLRVEPFCSHFGICGGCKWQMLPYEQQLQYKMQQVEDQFARIGKVSGAQFLPIIGSKQTQYYRNKLEFTFSATRWLSRSEIESGTDFNNESTLGFHVPARFDKVFRVEHCYLQPDPSNQIRLEAERFALANGYSFYNLRTHQGFLRNLIIRTSSLGQVMVILSVAKDDEELIAKLLGHLKETFPQIGSLMYVVNTKLNDTIGDLEVRLFHGVPYIVEAMEDLRFKVGPKSFYQTNSEQAYRLYRVTREFAGLKGTELVYDLYTGTGTIANFIAKECREVVGIEYVPEAIDDAKINSQMNGIENTRFFAGDMKELLTEEFVQLQGAPQVVILDPPRSGIHPDVARALLGIGAQRIVYVSCNPATQARDIALLSDKYHVVKSQPVDMFPQTHHVENVALLELVR